MPSILPRFPILTRLAVALALVGTAASLLAFAVPSPTRAAEQAVQIVDSSFSPGTLTITAGDTVTWTNADDRPHTVTSVDGAFDSGNLDEGRAFSFTFTEPGTYIYRCDYHPEMQATIVVEPADATSPSSDGTAAGGSAAGGSAPRGSEAPASDGLTSVAETHEPGTHSGGQPDTALEAPISLAWIAPLLIGLGLVSLAFGVIPPAAAREAVDARERPAAGWRR